MTPAERRTAYIRVLSDIDQQIAECESLLSESALGGDEVIYVAVKLDLHRQWRARVEKMLAPSSHSRER